MIDIAPLLLKKVKKKFLEEFTKNKRIKELSKLIDKGEATHVHSEEFGDIVGQILKKAFESITEEELPDGKMYYNIAKKVVEPSLQTNYDLISTFTQDTQTILNKKAGYNIKGISPEQNVDRIFQIIEKISDKKYKDIEWMLKDPIVTYSQSIVADTIEANANYLYKAGVSGKVIRRESGNCCKWCSEVAGIYYYPNVPKDVFRRHSNCRCVVEYYPSDSKKKQNVHTKEWVYIDKEEKIKKRKVHLQEDKNNSKIKTLAYAKAKELGYNPLPDNKVVEILRKDSDSWILNLTEEEKKAINKYTYNGVDKDGKRLFEKINGYLEGRYKPKNKKELDILDINILNIKRSILKNKIQHDIIVYRTDNYSDTLNEKVKKFLSTSVTTKGALKGKPNVVIIVPKGSKGAYVENLSDKPFKKQREFLINSDSKFKRLYKDSDFILFKLED